nr:MAG TPA: hypothetical protein [Siphoviridae sp. ctBWu8]DAK97055.1 MAG TPA: hypothetical protein [Caudoviricetes sp.]
MCLFQSLIKRTRKLILVSNKITILFIFIYFYIYIITNTRYN